MPDYVCDCGEKAYCPARQYVKCPSCGKEMQREYKSDRLGWAERRRLGWER